MIFIQGISKINPDIKENDNNSVTFTIGNESFNISLDKYRKIVSNPYAITEVKFWEVMKKYQEIEFEEIK